MTLRTSFARWCRTVRIDLDITQQQLADAVGVSRAYIAAIETEHANPSLALVDRIGAALGVRFDLQARTPRLIEPARPRDHVHAWCCGYGCRRLTGSGLLVAREVEVRDGRTHGWIDLLAFDPRTGVMLIIEVKTALDDIGRIERQVRWYERLAMRTEVAAAWQPTEVRTWLLVLATTQADAAIGAHRDILGDAFPNRAQEMRLLLAGETAPPGRGLALIDPRSRRRDWLIASRSEGRRWPAPYLDVATAASLMPSRPTR